MRHVVVVSAVVIASLLVACGGEADVDDGPESRGTAAESAGATDWTKGSWEVATAPADGGAGLAPAVWTGEELVFWGTPAVAFRPATRSWRPLPQAPITDRRGMVAVWTGSEVVYWGGASAEDRRELLADGAAYDPQSDSWRLVAPAPLPPRSHAVADMVAGAMVVWGGFTRCCPIDSVLHDAGAARYDPATDSWTRLGDVPAPWSGDGGPAVTVVVHDSLYVFRHQQLGRYDARADVWLGPPQPDAPASMCEMTGGAAAVAESSNGTIFTWSGGCQAERGFAFDIAAGQWRRTAKAPSDQTAWSAPSAAGDGVVFLLTSWTGGAAGPNSVHAYSVADDRWVGLPDMPEGVIGAGAELMWTGSELFVWGGWRQGRPVTEGAVYRPS